MLRKYFEEFMADVPEQLPQLIHKSWMKKPIIYDEYILLEFNFPQAFSLEDIMNMFEDQMELIILYHMVNLHLVRSLLLCLHKPGVWSHV